MIPAYLVKWVDVRTGKIVACTIEPTHAPTAVAGQRGTAVVKRVADSWEQAQRAVLMDVWGPFHRLNYYRQWVPSPWADATAVVLELVHDCDVDTAVAVVVTGDKPLKQGRKDAIMTSEMLDRLSLELYEIWETCNT